MYSQLYSSCMICTAAPSEATQDYLHQCTQRYQAQRDVDSQVPLFEQRVVHSKMLNFHSKLTSLEFHKCTTCLERFPDLTMSASGTECRRCSGDKHVPKLYSAANNMNPGPVPCVLALQMHCACADQWIRHPLQRFSKSLQHQFKKRT